MKNIIASEVNPATNPNLLRDLKEPEYLIELLQSWFQKHYEYNLNGKWDRTTPEDYRLVMNEQLRNIEGAVWQALHKAEERITNFRDMGFAQPTPISSESYQESDISPGCYDLFENASCLEHDRF